MPSTTLQRMDDAGDPTVGGVLCTFPSGTAKTAHWRSTAPVTDVLALAKDVAAQLLQTCLKERRIDDAERTNWPSVAAAVQHCILDFNETRRRALQAVDNLH